MPRRAKGPRLYFKGARRDAAGVITHAEKWVIRDGEREVSTGTSELAAAEGKLAAYIAEKHNPRSPDADKNPLVADVLAVYLQDKVLPRDMTRQRKNDAKAVIVRLDAAFGARRCLSLRPSHFTAFSSERGRAARRDLELLRAALNHAHKEHMLLHPIAVSMPEKYEGRTRWLTRSEMARLLLAAWRIKQTFPSEDGSKPTKRHTARHVARFIIVCLYTGSRAGAVCSAAMMKTIGRGHVDLERGEFIREPLGRSKTKKRAPTQRLHPALKAHIERWNRNSISERGRPLRHLIEYNGEPVERINKAFRAVREAAGFDADVVPHTIRHSVVSWAMQEGVNRFKMGGVVGMSQEIIERVYAHHDASGIEEFVEASRGRTKRDRPGFAPDKPERDGNVRPLKAR